MRSVRSGVLNTAGRSTWPADLPVRSWTVILVLAWVVAICLGPLLGLLAHEADVGLLDLDAARVADGVAQADQALGRPGDRAVHEEVGVAHDAVVREAALGRDLGAVGADLQDALVVLRALVEAALAVVGHRVLDPVRVPGALGADHAAVLAVLVRQQLGVEADDAGLEAVALGDGDGVHHLAGLEGLVDGDGLAEQRLGVLGAGLDVAAADA